MSVGESVYANAWKKNEITCSQPFNGEPPGEESGGRG